MQEGKDVAIPRLPRPFCLRNDTRAMQVRLTREFFILVLAANIIVWPLAWPVMNKWLQNFAFRVDFGVWPLLI
ncbi:MAG: hypothetical protein JSV96_02170, partial [Candidatus Aminicenantes bacterium]